MKPSPKQKLHFSITLMAFIAGELAFTILRKGHLGAIPLAWRVLIAVLCAATTFVWFFLEASRNEKKWKQLEQELEEELAREEEPPANRLDQPLPGFVVFESNGLTNQTFLICIAPEALYGWRVLKSLSTKSPLYYLMYLYMLDSEAMRDIEGIRKLTEEDGGFILSRSSIVSIDTNDKQKWNMTSVLHSGRIDIKTTDGRHREFLILGTESPESVRAKILHTSASAFGTTIPPLPYTAYTSRTEMVVAGFLFAIGIPAICWAFYARGNPLGSLLFGFIGLSLMALVGNALSSKTVFTETAMERISLLSKNRLIPYDSIQGFDAPVSNGSVRLTLSDDKELIITNRGRVLGTILTILAHKTDKLPRSLR